MKIYDIQNINVQIADFENAIEVLKKNKEAIEVEVSNMEDMENVSRSKSYALLDSAKSALMELQKRVDESTSGPVSQDSLQSVIDILTEESSLIQKINLAEDRLGVERTASPSRRIQTGQSAMSEVCEMDSGNGSASS